MPPIISIVGKSESGKTTLIEKLVPELKRRGYLIGVVKHSRSGFDIDKKGKDSWRHKQAGADMVMIASAGRIAMVKDDSCESLDCLEKYFQDMDLILTEGYKKENKPKIEVFRIARHPEPLCENDNTLIAMVTDSDLSIQVPKFGFEDIKALAALIEKKFL